MNFTLTPEDIEWLKDNFPNLKFYIKTPPLIKGLFEFEAVYQKEDGQKYPIIKDSYEIEIKLSNKAPSSLPEVREIGGKISKVMSEFGKTSADLHVNSDETVCLCPFTAEKEKLPNGFNLKDFFNKLLIPYFYEQSYFAKYKEWPWGEYSHGELGLWEHYFEIRGDGNNVKLIIEFIDKIKKFAINTNLALLERGKVKGHIICYCGSNKKIRDCHNTAYVGLWNLKEDIKRNKIRF